MRSHHDNQVAQHLLTTAQAASLLGLHHATLRSKRKAIGLPFVRIGGAIRYCLSDVQAFIDAHKEGGRV